MERNSPTYYAHERAEMVPFVPAEAKVILEIGCGGGGFAKLLSKSIDLKEYWGVEPVTGVTFLDNIQKPVILNLPVEEAWQQLPDAYFDCVVMNDVLEHLENTEANLVQARKKLRDGGCLVASIPNVRYIENLIELLIRKDWRYRAEGILDKSHLRFFTQKSIERTFTSVGFRIEIFYGINPNRHWKYVWLNRLLFNAIQDTLSLQFGMRARIKT